ncbi:MAG: DUF2934 domain-containing protein [Candidatus Omnitrophica bacterium]|nr:DUF2934 domain-containing protein [Candidatus Omnitrophota bacterium]
MAKKEMKKAGASFSQEKLTGAIREKAQEIYEKSGRKPGRDLENWLQAERIVKTGNLL